MIPKIIHYCWFGNKPKTEKMKKCIESWKKHCPDFQIIEWNEKNIIINDQCEYIKEAYKTQKYAFVSDVVRLKVLYEIGGVYLDTDVELLKPIDSLLIYKSFWGWQDEKYVANGLGFGAEKGNAIVKENLDFYLYTSFINNDGSLNMKPCPVITTEVLRNHGLKMQCNNVQTLDEAIVFPIDYFNPLNDATNRLTITTNTYSIHWYAKTWVSKKNKIRSRITRVFHRYFGVNCFQPLKKIITYFKR